MAMEFIYFLISMLLLVVLFLKIYTRHVWSTYDMDFIVDIKV
jgi:hypothetical protein